MVIDIFLLLSDIFLLSPFVSLPLLLLLLHHHPNSGPNMEIYHFTNCHPSALSRSPLPRIVPIKSQIRLMWLVSSQTFKLILIILKPSECWSVSAPLPQMSHLTHSPIVHLTPPHASLTPLWLPSHPPPPRSQPHSSNKSNDTEIKHFPFFSLFPWHDSVKPTLAICQVPKKKCTDLEMHFQPVPNISCLLTLRA